MHRLSPAPGFTVDVPDGFAACDPATNKLLGNAPQVIAITKVCEQAHHPDTVYLINLDPAERLDVLVDYTPKYVFSEKMISDATPEMLANLKEEVCGRTLKKLVQSSVCTASPGTLAGHPAFVIDGSVTLAGRESGIFRGYVLTRGDGLALFLFGAQAPVTGRVKAAMERIIASVKIENLPPAPPPEIVQLEVLSGIRIAVPKGWISCDPQLDASLGHAQDPFGARDIVCTDVDPLTEVRIFDPHLPVMTFIAVTRQQGAADAERFARDLEPAALTRDRDEDCQRLMQKPSFQDMATRSCETKAGTLSGLPAKLIDVSGTAAKNEMTMRMHSRVAFVVLKDNVFSVHLIANSLLEPTFSDAAETIVNSVVFPAEQK